MSNAQTSSIIKHLSAVEFNLAIQTPGVIVDVRTEKEFNAGHINKAVNISTNDPKIVNKLLALKKDEAIYLYCYSGARSRHVAIFLEKQGYTKIYNLRRGIIEWKQSKLPLEVEKVAEAPVPDKMSIEEFDKTLASESLVFVDFYAPWCLPCKQMMPMMDELEKEYAGKIKLVRVNADASSDLFKKIDASTVPFLVLYKNGKPVYTKNGKTEKSELKTTFDKYL